MNVINQYPSTLDLPHIAGGQDPVEAILVGARKRYKRGGTPETYIESGGWVCAIGAVIREAGVTPKIYDEIEDTDFSKWGGIRLTLKQAKVEKDTIDATREAILLLNKAAKALYPISKDHNTWSGPLEWVNQEYSRTEGVDPHDETEWRKIAKVAVLRCYDKAITDRRAALAA